MTEFHKRIDDLSPKKRALLALQIDRQLATDKGRADGRGGKWLVAYAVPDQELAPTISELRGFLKEKLPDYMMPSAFVLLDALPLTPNGKVDRQALPEPDRARATLDTPFENPRNSVEEVVGEIWAETLGIERLSIHDNFFEVGGHSLLAIQLISGLRGALQVEVPLRTLFEAPTVAVLAEALLQDSDKAERVEKAAGLLNKLAQLSDEEVETMLEAKTSSFKQEEEQ